MAQRVYATASDYYDFIGGDQPMTNPPEPEEGQEPESPQPIVEADLNASLRRASTVIDGLTRTVRYDIDEDGYPDDVDVSDAFRDATCAQVAWFEETDDITGADSQAGAVKIGSVSLGGSGATGNAQSGKTAASSRVAPEAIDILRNAGLLSGIVAHT